MKEYYWSNLWNKHLKRGVIFVSNETEVNKQLQHTWIHIIWIIITIVLSIVVVFAYKAKAELSVQLIDQHTKAENSKSQLEQKINELKGLKEKIEGIKDRDDLLKRDIELYIKATHRKVPSIVTKAIATYTVIMSRKYNISPELVIGIMKVESSFNPMIVGPKTKHGHARGLLQVMPEWVKKLGLKSQYDLHNIDIGIESGIQVFQIHLNEAKGDISLGLYKYVHNDKAYVGRVYAAMGKFVAFRSTIDEDIKTDINNGNTKEGDEKTVKSRNTSLDH